MKIKSNLAWQALLAASALLLGALAAFAEPQQASPPLITQITVDHAGQKTLVRVMGTGALDCRTMRMRNPERLVLDFPGARLAKPASSIPSAFPPVLGVHSDQSAPDAARVVIDLQPVAAYGVRSNETSVTVEFDVEASAPASSAPASRQFEESFKDGMLTFQAKNQSLRSVLQRIQDETGVSFYLAKGFGNDRISVEFQHYRLDEALRQILSHYEVYFLYGERQSALGSSALQAVWVYPVSRAETLSLLESAATTPKEAEPAQAGTGANAGSRVEPAAAPEAADPAAEVLQALKDPNSDVREQALSQALLAKVQIPQDTLVNLALTDPSEKVRLLALQALPVDPDLRWVAERAADDLSEDVTNAARGILRMLDLRERAKAWAERTPNPPEQ